ncbi:MAG: SBBP repeat-containing protein, partial [Bradymonadaceae bacterium]
QARNITTDTNGDIYITGRARSENGLADQPYAGGKFDAFVARLNPDGTRQWLRMFGDSEWEEARGIATDGDQGLYVTGRTSGAFGQQTYQGGMFDAFIAHYERNGARNWVQFLGTTGHDEGRRVASNAAGEAYLAGIVGGDLPEVTYSGGAFDGLLARYDSAGNRLSLQIAGTPGDDRFMGIDVDDSGVAYLAGRSNGGLG